LYRKVVPNEGRGDTEVTTKLESIKDEDERQLAELGYRQDLNRSWSAFSNFAISFTIISVLAGCFTTYGQAWNNGGPVAISWGWPLISIPILIIGFSMSELVAKFPTAGGIYWWAARLGGPVWGWFTGWFNLIGLIGVCASVVYASATFLNFLLGSLGVSVLGVDFADGDGFLQETFLLFVIIIALHALLNITRTNLLAMINNVSVFWHVAGVAVIIAILVIVPDDHQSLDFVFTERFNNSGFSDGSNSSGFFWLYVLPLGFLLTQYTITGFDASAHVSEETHGASKSAAQGVWRSIFYSALIGWFVLLAITFAATNTDFVNDVENGFGIGSALSILNSSLTETAFEVVLAISTIGQLFCGAATVTSASRMCFAFSRDRGLPGSKALSTVNSKGVPRNAVLTVVALSLLITLPALKGDEAGFPFAFFAVVSIAVIGLYIAYVIPIYLRWRMGSAFEQSPAWNLGSKWRWMNPIAVIWVAIITVIFSLPFTPLAVPWDDAFDARYVNYAPVTVAVVLLVVGIWWKVSAHKYFTGQVRNVEIDEALNPDLASGQPDAKS
jgi:amino acid transporter